MTEEPIESAPKKICPRCKVRLRYIDKRGRLHGYCLEDRNDYQRKYQKARYKPVSKEGDGRGFDRRVREAKEAAKGIQGVCCICLDEPASYRYQKPPLCEEDAELIRDRKLILTPGMYHYLSLGKNLRLAPDISLFDDPDYDPVPPDADGNVPGSPWNKEA